MLATATANGRSNERYQVSTDDERKRHTNEYEERPQSFASVLHATSDVSDDTGRCCGSQKIHMKELKS